MQTSNMQGGYAKSNPRGIQWEYGEGGRCSTRRSNTRPLILFLKIPMPSLSTVLRRFSGGHKGRKSRERTKSSGGNGTDEITASLFLWEMYYRHNEGKEKKKNYDKAGRKCKNEERALGRFHSVTRSRPQRDIPLDSSWKKKSKGATEKEQKVWEEPRSHDKATPDCHCPINAQPGSKERGP